MSMTSPHPRTLHSRVRPSSLATAIGALSLALMPGACSDSESADPPGHQAKDASADTHTDTSTGCTPLTCTSASIECGKAPDGCGGVASCAPCPAGTQCGGGGPNRCGSSACIPKTCADLGVICGIASDQCSDTVDCGPCPEEGGAGGSGGGGEGGSAGAGGSGGEQDAGDADAGTTYGWDYNLTKACAATLGTASDTNYWQTTAGCEGGSLAHGFWLAQVHSYKGDPSVFCPGPENRTFPINGTDSPVTLSFAPHSSSLGPNLIVNMGVATKDHLHPCGAGHFTRLRFADHVAFGKGVYPKPRDLISHHVVTLQHEVAGPSDGCTLMLGASFQWSGKTVDISVELSANQWGDSFPNDPCLIYLADLPGFTPIALSGKCFAGLDVAPGAETTLDVHWRDVIDSCIAAAYVAAPADWSTAETLSTYFEVMTSNEANAFLSHTDFRLEAEP
jgi:hypothetical protein